MMSGVGQLPSIMPSCGCGDCCNKFAGASKRIGVMRAIGLGLGLLGSVIGCYAVWFELTKGSESPTSAYIPLGVTALALAIGGGAVPFLLRHRPARAAVAMITLGGLGYLASAV